MSIREAPLARPLAAPQELELLRFECHALAITVDKVAHFASVSVEENADCVA
jgi:hypothetical protein